MERSEDFELQYSPSRWSKRYSAEEVVQRHVDFVIKASIKAKNEVPCQLDISYGALEAQKMNVFGTHLPPDSPILIFIHGGYWQELSREVSAYMVKPLIKNNFKVIVLGYTLCPKVSLSQIIEEIQNGFLKCIEYAKTNGTGGVYLCGHSAGAHLIASLFDSFFTSLPLTNQQVLKGLFLISGVFNIVPLVNTYVNDALKLDHATAKQLSPFYHNLSSSNSVLRNTPIFVIVGEYDSPAFIEQSKNFYNKLKALEYKTQFIVVKQVDHFNIVELLNNDEYEIIKLIITTNGKNCVKLN